jgi:hypothetical protein
MTIFDQCFPLGLGTNRFPIKSATDDEGIDCSAQIVVEAVKSGVQFIDVAHTYSRGMAQEALRRAFRQTGEFEGVTVKTRLNLDQTADDVRRRTEGNLRAMGLSRAKYFYCWSIMSYGEFESLFQKGGIYEGAQKLKDEGIVDHLCFSVHAPVGDIVKMLKSQAFEAVTISFSLLNSLRYGEVLRTASNLGIGVAAMNPLGGGIVPSNQAFFSFARCQEKESVPEAALRYVLAHKNIQIALSGVSSLEELRENIQTVVALPPELPSERIARVDAHIKQIENFCTGCNYCAGCPENIPISAIMQCRNYLTFGSQDPNYTFADKIVQENIFALGKLEQEYSILFETADNPCIHCGKCERVCTQHLHIMDAIVDTFRRAKRSAFSRQERIRRLQDIIDNSKDNIVGMYPSGITCLTVRRFYEENIGRLKCRLALFDSNPAVWGKTDDGIQIYAPQEIPKMKPSVVIITSYKFKDEIYEAIRQYEDEGIRIVKLYEDHELPWLL